VLRVLVYAGLIYGGLRLFEWKSLYHPLRSIEYTPADAGLEYEEAFFVTSDDVELHGWWIPGEDSIGTVIVCHGNAGNIGSRVWLAADLREMGLNVFLFDYRGYGLSGGIATEKGTYRDAHAAYEYVRMKYSNMERPPVMLFGRSLGGAVALQCALDKPVKGLVMENSFESIPAMARKMYPALPLSYIVVFSYDNISKISSLQVPVLMAASRDDKLVPYEQSRKLYENAPQPKFWFDLKGGHNDAGWESTPAYGKAMEKFIGELFDSGP